MLSRAQQGYTGVTVPNSMNHVQRAVTYVTPRNAMGSAGAGAGTPVHPYRAAFVNGPPTHVVDHSANGAPMPYGQAHASSRLVGAGAVSPGSQPRANPPQLAAFARTSPQVTAAANNLGHGVSNGQRTVNNGVRKTGSALG